MLYGSHIIEYSFLSSNICPRKFYEVVFYSIGMLGIVTRECHLSPTSTQTLQERNQSWSGRKIQDFKLLYRLTLYAWEGKDIFNICILGWRWFSIHSETFTFQRNMKLQRMMMQIESDEVYCGLVNKFMFFWFSRGARSGVQVALSKILK